MPANNYSKNELTLEQLLAIQNWQVIEALETLLDLEPQPVAQCPNCLHSLPLTLWESPLQASINEAGGF
jgi:hypothetical protein